jgi:ATP/maltotriose-dependent transcriptional regulator MalT
MTLARVLHARGDLEGALERLQDAEQVSQQFPFLPSLIQLIERYKVRVWLAQSDSQAALAAAVCWAQEACIAEPGENGTFSAAPEWPPLSLAQVFLAQDRADRALRLLDRLGEAALAGGRKGSC